MSITDELREWAKRSMALPPQETESILAIADRIDEEAKLLCRKAFDGGADYGSTSMQYNCNAVAYDWDHWLKKNKSLFMPKPTVEDVLTEFAIDWECSQDGEDKTAVLKEYAAKLRLAGDAE